jgi:hypothetical protein
MAPSFLKSLRRRSRASFRTDRSTDESSEGVISNGTGPSSGFATPSSIAHQSDPALNLQVNKDTNPAHQNGQPNGQPNVQTRPPLAPTPNTNRYSSSGMSGLGAPSVHGRQGLPTSPYAPRIHNVSENAWVRQSMADLTTERVESGCLANLLYADCPDLGIPEDAVSIRIDWRRLTTLSRWNLDCYQAG